MCHSEEEMKLRLATVVENQNHIAETLKELKESNEAAKAEIFKRLGDLEQKLAENRGREMGKAYVMGILFTLINIVIALITVMAK